MSSARRSVLGRGLGALIPEANQSADSTPTASNELPLSEIFQARSQPRTVFDQDRIQELANSIRENGLLQPIVVRRDGAHRYVIIAGERRYRASKLLGLSQIPVVVRDVTDAQAFELALVENIQREDLDAIEEAHAYQHLSVHFKLTQEQIAKKVGKERATIANALRLLKLDEQVQLAVSDGELSAGHGRAILVAPQQNRAALAEQAIDKGWSVRETERQARNAREAAEPKTEDPTDGEGERPEALAKRRATRAIEDQLRSAIGAPVRLVHRGGKGRIELRFHSMEELDRLIDLFAHLQDR